MKIVYCHCSLYNPGGMERVLLNKVSWLAARGHEVVVVTTDQGGRPPFYQFPEAVRMVDLGINYSADNGKRAIDKIAGYLRKKRIHRRRLSSLLMHERPDVTVSLYPSESSFIPAISDGSKKVLELHFNRYFRLQYGRRGLLGLIDRMRSRQDARLAAKFDRFVVLTEEDREYWGALRNMVAIPNAALPMAGECSDCTARRVIAVGRLDYQKGFDRLLRIWAAVMADASLRGWHLDIFGRGEWREMLGEFARDLGIDGSVTIHEPVNDIAGEYRKSSILAMTSHYEGFPMVMIEGMSMGLPVVTFDFKCGPRDIISHGHNGLVVSDGDEPAFAQALASLMRGSERRMSMGANARDIVNKYSEASVMRQWASLFESLARN